jgi:hypothetical protein
VEVPVIPVDPLVEKKKTMGEEGQAKEQGVVESSVRRQ